MLAAWYEDDSLKKITTRRIDEKASDEKMIRWHHELHEHEFTGKLWS